MWYLLNVMAHIVPLKWTSPKNTTYLLRSNRISICLKVSWQWLDGSFCHPTIILSFTIDSEKQFNLLWIHELDQWTAVYCMTTCTVILSRDTANRARDTPRDSLNTAVESAPPFAYCGCFLVVLDNRTSTTNSLFCWRVNSIVLQFRVRGIVYGIVC